MIPELKVTNTEPNRAPRPGLGILNSLMSFLVGVALLGKIHIALFRLNPVPLSSNVAQALCSMFELPSSDHRCGDAPVFAVAFLALPGYQNMPHPYRYAFPSPSGPYMRRGQIENVAGVVKLGCTEWSQGWANGWGRPHYQECHYDLTGNGLTLLSATYMAVHYDSNRFFEYYSPEGTPLTTPEDPIFFIGDLFGGYAQSAF